MTFPFCGFIFDSSNERTRQMPVASEDWVPHPAKITSSITTVKGATIQSTTTSWMSPYSRASPSERPTSNNNNNNNNNGVVILEGCRPPAATTARRFLRWFSRLGQPPMGKSGNELKIVNHSFPLKELTIVEKFGIRRVPIYFRYTYTQIYKIQFLNETIFFHHKVVQTLL